MAAKFGGHLLKTIQKPDFFVRFLNGLPSFYHSKPGPDFSSASLDRFIQKIILFMTLFY
jgi:hypothetical protein